MEAAQAKVEEEYYNSEHILDSENFTGVDFSAEAEREIVQEPVSYTHLDVYKRQTPALPGCTMCPPSLPVLSSAAVWPSCCSRSWPKTACC